MLSNAQTMLRLPLTLESSKRRTFDVEDTVRIVPQMRVVLTEEQSCYRTPWQRHQDAALHLLDQRNCLVDLLNALAR